MFVAPFEIGDIALHLFRAACNMGLRVSGKTAIRSRGWLLGPPENASAAQMKDGSCQPKDRNRNQYLPGCFEPCACWDERNDIDEIQKISTLIDHDPGANASPRSTPTNCK
jgi:hypothetical protein